MAREDEGFTLRWNVDCEAADTAGSTSFYLCGEGGAFATEGTMNNTHLLEAVVLRNSKNDDR